MAKSFGINIITQLNRVKTFAPGGTEAGGTSGTSFTSTSFDAGGLKLELSTSEKTRLALSLLGVLSLYFGPLIVESHERDLQAAKQREIAVVDQDIQTEKTKLSGLSGIRSQIADYESQMKVLQEKLSIVESVQKNKNSLVRMVDFVTSQMPENVWFSKLNVSIEKGAGNDGSKFEILGSALTLQVVSEFMKRLENAVFFPTWDLIETENKSNSTVAEQPANEFGSVSTKVKTTDEPSEFKSFQMSARIVSL